MPESRWGRAARFRDQGLGVAAVAALSVLGLGMPHWERAVPSPGLNYEVATAQATLAAISGGMITLSGFVITAVTLVIQTVQNMSPRLIGVVRHFGRSLAHVGLLIGTAVYALIVLAQTRTADGPQLSVALAILLVVMDTVVLLRAAVRLGLRRLAACVRVGRARVIDQDPAYGLRLLVDMAIRALSPAVNDQTTAVQVLDHLQDALVRLSHRPVGRTVILDGSGVPRLTRPAAEWPELVSLVLDEILQYGAGSLQVVRRMRALLTEAAATVTADRTAPLEERVAALDRLTRSFPDPLFASVAEGTDRQGLGGVKATSDLLEGRT